MRVSRSFRRLVVGALVVAVTAGGSLFLGGLANAAPVGSLGSLTFTPESGSDLTIQTAHTSAPCPATSNAAFMQVTGPIGAATQTFPPDNPFNIVTTQVTSFSAADPFDLEGGLDLKTAADARGTQLAAGEYDFTVHCVNEETLEPFGTFAGAIYFTSATAWQITDPNGPTPSPTVSPEPSPTVSPEPSPTVSPEPSPTVSPEPSPTASPEPSPTVSPEPSPTVSPEPSPTATPTPGGGDLLERIIAQITAALQRFIQFLLFLSLFNFGPR